jgi:hypothetical protein
MAHIKNQQKFHIASANNKTTICGLSNQHSDAVSKEAFLKYLADKDFKKHCCKKCTIN